MVMSKAGAEVILKSLLNRYIDVENLPWGPEDERVPAGIETVVVADEVRPKRGATVRILGDDGKLVTIKEEPMDD